MHSLKNTFMMCFAGSLGLIVLHGITACTQPENGKANSSVSVTFDVPLLDTLFVLTTASGVVYRTHCPAGNGAENAILSCRPDGVTIRHLRGDMQLVVKSRGYSFEKVSLYLAPEDANKALNMQLTPLSGFVSNEQYATGFNLADGLAQFKGKGVTLETELGTAVAVKFYIDQLHTSPRVYFQDTHAFPLHYLFARNVLGSALSATEFETITYHGDDRDQVGGVLLLYESLQVSATDADTAFESPLLLTFASYDTISAELVAKVHQLIEARLNFIAFEGGTGRLIFLPATEEKSIAMQKQNDFASYDIAMLSYESIYSSQRVQILNNGLAYGTLKLLTPEALDTEVVSMSDILLLTRLPATLPLVGGTITMEAQTPLAHVNVAARARNTPNIAHLDAGSDPHIAALIGKLVRFEVLNGTYTIEETTESEAEAFWQTSQRPQLAPEFDIESAGLVDFAASGFADSVRIGAKAANLAELHQLLGAASPDGFAIPFYYYEQFMQNGLVTPQLCAEAALDCIEEGRTGTICETAKAECLTMTTDAAVPLSRYVVDMAQSAVFQRDTPIREAMLDAVCYSIRHLPLDNTVAAALKQKAQEMFGNIKLRLRSSTNAEDLMEFSGAGLYESVSAYAAGDDKPIDTQIRKVWASVWQWRAYEERRFWNMDHNAVKMGVAVHQAYPDEAANGVLITRNLSNPMENGLYVNVQLGETSVTNPENGATPEISVLIPVEGNALQKNTLAFSSISPETPILTRDEEYQLTTAAMRVGAHFQQFYNQMPLEMEFKFHGSARALVIKQVRPYLP